MSSQLQQENISLKKQVTILRKQLALNKQQLAEQQIVYSSKHKSFRNEIIPEKPNNETNHLESTTHTLSATFDALQSSHKNGLVNHKNQKLALSKYEQMRQIGVDIDIIILQMRKDQITENLITHFSHQHIISDSDYCDTDKFSKYNRMKTNGAPFKSILNTMQFDRLSPLEIDEFCNNMKESEFGLPQKLQILKPKHKMKHIHWKSIKLQNINTSIWNNMNHKWNDYENKQIESKFKIKLNAIKLDKTHLINNVSIPFSGNNKQIKKVNFIPPNRSKQVMESLKLFNVSNSELRNIILSMNDNKIDINLLKILLEIIPTPCEQLIADRMSELQNVKSFGITERFFYSLCDIIELKQRINNWVFKLEFELRIKELIEEINIIESAKLIIILSKEFKQILNIILGLGNYMNYGKKNSNAYGFCISDLNLLQEIKTSDNSMTFLMYLCSFLHKKYPNVLNVIERFKIVHKAAVINGDNIYKKYKELLQEIKDLNTLVIRYKNEHYQIPNSNDMFYAKMVNFEEIIYKKINQLSFKIDSLHKCENELIEYFGIDRNTFNDNINIQKIFIYISTFIFELQYSNINLKQFEQIKKKIRSNKKRMQKKGQRRAVSDNLTRNSMTKYVSTNTKPKLKTASSFDDAQNDEQTNKKNNINMSEMMNTFDENKTSEYNHIKNERYGNALPGVPKTKPKLIVSQSADHYIGPTPSPEHDKTNIISFGRFKNNNNNIQRNAVIHSYDYSGNYSNIIDENKINNSNNININAAIVHGYHTHNNEPNLPRHSNHNNEQSFCLYTSNSQLVEQRFGAVLDSPTVNIDGINRNKLNKKSNVHGVNTMNKFQNI